MLYAEQHWTKAVDLNSTVERLYEKLGALEFDADHEAIYGMEIYYTVQQCEKLRNKYKIGRKVTMDVNSIENCAIKSEVIVTETFSFGQKYGDGRSAELKIEPLEYKESFKCKEEDCAEHLDIHAAPFHQYSRNEYYFTEKDSVVGHSQITKDVQYFCKECNFATHLECSIKEHLRIHNGVDKICDFKTPLILPSSSHLTKPSDDKYSCNECNYSTLIKKYLRRHVKIHKCVKYSCEECNYKTVRKRSLKQHTKIHTGDEYKCKECDYKTVRKDRLQKHSKIHTGDEYRCNDCDYKTVWEYLLKQHVKIHTGDEYKCAECDYKTVWEYLLKQHGKIHSGDEYKCKECDFKTVQKGNFNRHIKIHTGDKYKCKDCDYKTGGENYLKEHVKIHTGDEHKCKECDYKTVRKNALKEHLKIHTGDEYKCKECEYKTIWKKDLKEHLKIHTGDEYKCKECDYKTVWKYLLKGHVKIHTSDRYRNNSLFFCNDATFMFFIDMEAVFRLFYDIVTPQNINAKDFFVNNMKLLPEAHISVRHNLKFKIISRYKERNRILRKPEYGECNVRSTEYPCDANAMHAVLKICGLLPGISRRVAGG
ncbi:hypothetical protein FQA39_LY05341 [Lamprigera yunnana]|nr:hypothetical protein FQA39_LY05341 [Lamprigera yunnana]